MLQVPPCRVERVLPARRGESAEHGRDDARVVVAQHRVQDPHAHLVAAAAERPGECRTHPEVTVGVHARQHQREVVAVVRLERRECGSADPGVARAHLADETLAEGAVWGEPAERAQRFAPHDVARRVERGRGGDRSQQPRSQLGALEPHRHPGRGPPVEARARAVEERHARGPDVLQSGEGEEREPLLAPLGRRVAGVVAAHRHAIDRLGKRIDDEPGDRQRRPRVPDPAERLGRASAHLAVRVLERGEQTIDRERTAREAEREGGHPAHLDLLVVQEIHERRQELGVRDPPGRERCAAPHPAVRVSQAQRQLAPARRAPVLEL